MKGVLVAYVTFWSLDLPQMRDLSDTDNVPATHLDACALSKWVI